MKKLLLSASAMLFALTSANAQLTTTSVTETFGATPVLFWYSGQATASNGTATTGQILFNYTNANATYTTLAADFGNDGATPTPNANTINLTSMADIEVVVQNTGTVDAVLRLYLKDNSTSAGYPYGRELAIEPNISDVGAAGTAYGYTTPNESWISQQRGVYPAPALDAAVYPRVAFNGFVLQAGTTRTIRLDLSSVANTIGGRYTDFSGGGTVATSPNSNTASGSGFDITKVKALEFKFNENIVLNLSDNAVDKKSYMYDVTDVAKQGNGNAFVGNLVIHSVKIGSVLAPLPNDITTGITDAQSAFKLSVFPNPAKDALTVSFEAASGATVSLSNVSGHKVLSSTVAAGANEVTLNTSGLASGIYILNVATENGTEARKVVIQ